MMELQGGTITFLFTDIEGSTKILRRLGPAYADLMADHNRLLRQVFEEAGGRELGDEGDSFFVAFRRPSEAVHAAATAQRAVAQHEWPDGIDLRVRIGIDTGEASVANGRYLSVAVHRAARICAVAHGGQVLLSETTHALVSHEDGVGDIELRNLGPQRLKDFDRPVRLYQLAAPGLAADFPPLRSGEPTKEAPFAGREAELAAAAQRAAEGNGGDRIRVLLVDDQALVRAGFRMILEAERDMEVVGEAADGTEALSEARRLRPDVVLMDVRMPELDGIEATRRLLAADGGAARIVMLTTFDMDEYVYEALRAGASGFLLKDVPPEQLVAGVRAVASGEALLAPAVTKRVIEEFVRRPPGAVKTTPPELEQLTERELEVLKLIARGLSNAEIAKELYVSDTTVKTHVARILMKLRLRDRVQAVVFAYESGLIQPGAGPGD